MGHIGFKSKDDDPDVWMCFMTWNGGSQVYKYVLLYVDDCLVISDNAKYILKRRYVGILN